MKNGDARGACIAIICIRVSGTNGVRPPRAAALGLRLEQGDLPAEELAALCASAIANLPLGGQANAAPHWLPSDALRALLDEYQRVQERAALTRRATA
jgi:hypothetical protein